MRCRGWFSFGCRGRSDRIVTPRRAPQVASLNIPVSSNFNLESFLSSDAVIQDWTAKGLPADEHSVQNGILTTAASRFPLCIDPQQQAVSWIKNMYGKDQLKIKSLSESDFMKHLELAIQFGAPFLFENVDEELDPMLDPVRARRPVVLWVVSFLLKRPFGPRRGRRGVSERQRRRDAAAAMPHHRDAPRRSSRRTRMWSPARN